MDAVAHGRIPSWGAGLAFPGARVVVIRADGDDPFRILRHELAHLALHQSIKGRVPLWFDEGYAVLAAGELGRLESLRLNLTVARGRVPGLAALDAGLRGGQSTAEASYALAGTAVAFLARRYPDQSLVPLLGRLERGEPFDSAVARSTGLAPGRFEDAWQRDVRRRHGVGLWFLAGGMWAAVGGLVVAAWLVRRRRDRPRRAALDIGWEIDPGAESLPGEEVVTSHPERSPNA